MPYDFIGAGGLAYDLVLSVDRLPLADEKYSAELIGKLPGGFIANATCAAARLGLKTAFLGWVGDDSEGEMLRANFFEWNVNPVGLVSVKGEHTPFTVVITDHYGKRAIVLPASSLYDILFSYEQLQIAAEARVVYTFPRDQAWCSQLRTATLDSGGLLALDVESSAPMTGDELRDVIRMADVVFITEPGLRKMGLRSIRDLVEPRQWVILTAGSKGAYGLEYGQRKPLHQPALPVPVVDSTGAGDCFHAALLAARLNGANLVESMRFANAAAALKVQQRGARGGLPTRAEVEGLIQANRYRR
ncbi:MAG: carbohydrate kinase family protein [Chloroflexi bacterium]|nr:carbohydrate kinase family protein [Chloroflexota bacterium]